MKELKILQDICLRVYGVSLADISIQTFEHLDAIVWSMSTIRSALLDEVKTFDEIVQLNCECPCCDESFDGCCCDSCGFEDIHDESCSCDSDNRTEVELVTCPTCKYHFHIYMDDPDYECPVCENEIPYNKQMSLLWNKYRRNKVTK